MASSNVWIEDAQIITDSKDLTRSQNSILLKTGDVSDFLSESRTTSCAIIAPKGFGKTFVMKLKRIALQDSKYACFPNGSILDRPKDRPPILPTDIINFLEQSANWETLWQVAFCLCFLKGHRDDALTKEALLNLQRYCEGNHSLSEIITNNEIDTPFDILHSCLSAQRNEIFDIIRQAQHFTRSFQKIHRPSAIFVDNIDEYLQHYINFSYVKREVAYAKYLSIWHNGQIGAWLAIRRLQGINPHVKIFISIRKEAYHYASKHEAEFANLRAFKRELRYTKSDIKRIIENNIQSENPKNLREKDHEDAILRFVGRENELVSNSGTGKQESIADYWLRHCSLRPRDAVAIGGEISGIPVHERSGSMIRSAINTSAAERVQNLFAEVMPFLDSLFPEILPKVITSNVISWDEINAAAKRYSELVASEYGFTSHSSLHPFCALYSIGLIGVVHTSRDDHNKLVQTFAGVGEVPFGDIGVLPLAERYVVHPSLSDYIGRKNVTFYKRLNKHNVIGHGLEWRPEEDVRFVLVGDVRGYRESIMSNVGNAQTFARYWHELFRTYTLHLDYADTFAGDSVLIADRSPSRVLRAVKAIRMQLVQSGYSLPMRFGGHCGYWRIDHDADGVAHPEIADIVGVAARLEPLARSGDILLSDEFVASCQKQGFKFDPGDLVAVESDYVSADRFSASKGVMISKPDKETQEWRQLFYISSSVP